MFHECSKCKRRWGHSLSGCPYCLIPLKKIAAKTAKVKSVVKVNIPTLFHPAVPYYLLLLEDEFGNLWGHKSEREYSPGEDFSLTPAQNKETVAIWRVKYDLREATEKTIGLAGGIKIDAASKVLVLPTITKPSHAYFCDNTSPQALEAMLEILLAQGVKPENITVASQSFDDTPVAAIAQKSGLLAVCAKHGITPIDLATTGFGRIDPPAGEARPAGGSLEVSQLALGADLVINLAIGKMGQASATANLFKVLRKENYLGQKYLSSDKEIAATLEAALDRTITVMEAENVQRSNKLTAFVGLVLTSASCRNADRIFNEVTQSFKLPEIIKEIPAESIPIVGRSIKEVQYCAEIF